MVSFHIFSPLHSNSFASSFLASLPRFFPLSVFQLQRLQRNYRYLGKDEILVVVVERQLYFSAHTLSLRDPLLDSLFCHEIFTNIQDGGIILPAFRRKSTSHPKRPVPFLPPPSLPLSLSFSSPLPINTFIALVLLDSALFFFYIPFPFLYLYSFLSFFSFSDSLGYLSAVPSNLTARLLVVLFLEIDHATFYTLKWNL